MLENLVFSLERIAPFFLLIAIGILLRVRGTVPGEFFSMANRFVYRFALPLNLFYTIVTPVDRSYMNPGLLQAVGLLTLGSFFVIWGATELFWRDKALIGTLVQGAFRGNFALLGIPLAGAVAGTQAAQAAAFAVVVIIPVFNAMSVVVLMLRGKHQKKPDARRILGGVVTNPLIIATAIAIPFFLAEISLPYFASQTIGYIAGSATPLGLLAIGGCFNLRDATARLRPALYSSVIKVLILPLIAVPLAVAAGFRGGDLMVLFIAAAAPGAVSSYPMACAMGGDGPLASNVLILTTLLSSFVFATGIYLLRSLGYV